MILFFLFFSVYGIAQQKASKQNQKKSNDYLKKGLESADAGNFETAISLFSQSIQHNPSNKDALLAMADATFQLKNYDSTILLIEKLILIDSSKEKVLSLPLVKSFMGSGDFIKAKSVLNAAVNKSYIDTVIASKLGASIDFSSNISEKNISGGLKIENLGLSINTKYSEYFPAVTYADSIMVFTRRIAEGSNEDFFSALFKDGLWQLAKPLSGKINTPLNEGGQKISSDGKTMVFTGCNYPDGLGSCDLYYSVFEQGSWVERKNFGHPVNSPYWESAPCLTSDMKSLYFSSNRPGGYGGMDLYISHYLGSGKWSEPQNLGSTINTAGDEMFPFLHFDNTTFYFTSNGWRTIGGSDIFVSRKIGHGYSTPLNLGYPINTIDNESGLVVNGSGKLAYFSSDRYGGFGQMDIYQFKLPEEAQSFPLRAEEKIILNNIEFETAKWDLRRGAESSLNILAEFLLQNPTIRIQINGHTDDVGSEADNLTLSLQRAKSVVEYLISKGIDQQRLTFKGFGSSQPIADNQTESGRAKNRRTEMVILSNE